MSEPKINEVEVNGIRQVSKITKETITKSFFDIENNKEVLRTISAEDGSSEIKLIDTDFWHVVVNGKKADENKLKSIGDGPYKILTLLQDKTVEIIL